MGSGIIVFEGKPWYVKDVYCKPRAPTNKTKEVLI